MELSEVTPETKTCSANVVATHCTVWNDHYRVHVKVCHSVASVCCASTDRYHCVPPIRGNSFPVPVVLRLHFSVSGMRSTINFMEITVIIFTSYKSSPISIPPTLAGTFNTATTRTCTSKKVPVSIMSQISTKSYKRPLQYGELTNVRTRTMHTCISRRFDLGDPQIHNIVIKILILEMTRNNSTK